MFHPLDKSDVTFNSETSSVEMVHWQKVEIQATNKHVCGPTKMA